MKKNIFKCCILISLILPLTGCWDYVGLNEVTIVSGIAIDKNAETGKYELTFEIIDIAESSKEEGIETSLVESSGNTIFDAVRNAKKRVENKLYFSATEIIIISNSIAKQDGIRTVFDFFLRDAEFRETITFGISAEKTANELMKVEPIGSAILSYETRKIIQEDNLVTSSTMYMEICRLFNSLEGEGRSITIPYIKKVQNDENISLEVDGMSIFKNDKMINSIDSYEGKYYLFIDDAVEGGILTLDINDNKNNNISLEISKSRTNKTFDYKDGTLTVKIDLDTDVFIGEANKLSYPLRSEDIDKINKEASKKIEREIKKLITKAQKEFKTDIFSFGNLVYSKDYKLWKKLEKNWDDIFIDIKVEVNSTVHSLNSAFIQ